jgi:hypothetical protein
VTSLSRYQVGDLVEVCTEEEILGTLDDRGMVDGMPFMPEMREYCGRQFRVSKVAHKTCDTIHYSGIRRLPEAVHLEDLRCDGSAHGGCQAACLIVWKDRWLKPAGSNQSSPRTGKTADTRKTAHTPVSLKELTATVDPKTSEAIYTCQVTELLRATSAWAWWNPAQYIADVRTGNFSFRHVVRTLYLAALRKLAVKFPNYGAFQRLHDWSLRRCHRPAHIMRADIRGQVKKGDRTPESPDLLRAGDWVRIKPAAEILPTLNLRGKNRGLTFDPEMTPYCGSTYQVRGVVRRLIDEPTGRMLEMQNPCIALEGVVCNSEYSEKRFMCPRGILSYWRPIWLDKIEGQNVAEVEQTGQNPSSEIPEKQ